MRVWYTFSPNSSSAIGLSPGRRQIASPLGFALTYPVPQNRHVANDPYPVGVYRIAPVHRDRSPNRVLLDAVWRPLSIHPSLARWPGLPAPERDPCPSVADRPGLPVGDGPDSSVVVMLEAARRPRWHPWETIPTASPTARAGSPSWWRNACPPNKSRVDCTCRPTPCRTSRRRSLPNRGLGQVQGEPAR